MFSRKVAADAVVNAANMEIVFGSGISGQISDQTHARVKIDDEAAQLTQKFNQYLLQLFLHIDTISLQPPR
jgi:O-acetyl-ADP-ribose deacetylase (regulator of RNase III)